MRQYEHQIIDNFEFLAIQTSLSVIQPGPSFILFLRIRIMKKGGRQTSTAFESKYELAEEESQLKSDSVCLLPN